MKRLIKILAFTFTMLLAVTACSKKEEVNIDLSKLKNNIFIVDDNRIALYKLADLKKEDAKPIKEIKDSFKGSNRVLVSKDNKWGMVLNDRSNIIVMNLKTGETKEIKQMQANFYPAVGSQVYVVNNLDVSIMDFNAKELTPTPLFTFPAPQLPEEFNNEKNQLASLTLIGNVGRKFLIAAHTKPDQYTGIHNSFIYMFNRDLGTYDYVGLEKEISSYPVTMNYNRKTNKIVYATQNQFDKCASFTTLSEIDLNKSEYKIKHLSPYKVDKNFSLNIADFDFTKEGFEVSSLKMDCRDQTKMDRIMWSYVNSKWQIVESGENVLKRRTIPGNEKYFLDADSLIDIKTEKKLFKKLVVNYNGEKETILGDLNNFEILPSA